MKVTRRQAKPCEPPKVVEQPKSKEGKKVERNKVSEVSKNAVPGK